MHLVTDPAAQEEIENLYPTFEPESIRSLDERNIFDTNDCNLNDTPAEEFTFDQHAHQFEMGAHTADGFPVCNGDFEKVLMLM